MHFDNTVRPSSLAVANLAWHIEGKGLADFHVLDNGIAACSFTDSFEKVYCMYATKTGRPDIAALPPEWVARDTWGNDLDPPFTVSAAPVYVTVPANDTRSIAEVL